MLTRRKFLNQAAGTGAALLLRHSVAQTVSAAPELRLHVNPRTRLATMPEDFTGLSYESAQLGHPEFFSAGNRQLIHIFRSLTTRGVLRIGGNTEEYTTWSSNDSDSAKNQTSAAIGPDAGTAAKTASILTPQAIRNLRQFLDATGWHAIYGLNLWHGTVQNAVAEAKYVYEILGPRLIVFQIGNEPDMDHDPGSKERWTFDHYWQKWSEYHAAVHAALPRAQFAAPDIAKEYDWVTKTAEKKPDLLFLSGHYYAEGPPKDPKMTLEYLLRRGRNPATEEIPIVQAATKLLGRPFRMTEGNSCFHGGKPGVSDTFASALWSGDYMLQVAQAVYIGVNLHGGGQGYYTPISGSVAEGFQARPVFYGMLLAQRFAGHTFVDAALSPQTSPQNATAFAAVGPDERWAVALFNKAADPVTIRVSGLPYRGHISRLRLQAPSIASQSGVTFGGQSITPEKQFQPQPESGPNFTHGELLEHMPGYSAVVLEA